MFAIDALVVVPYLLVAAADHVPNIDINKTCRVSVEDSSAPRQDLEECIVDQNEAREELTKEWRTYSGADRQHCTSMAVSGYLPSYVELLVCLQFARQVKTFLEENGSMQATPSSKHRALMQ